MKRARYLLSLNPEVNEDDALSVLPPPRGNHRSFVSAVNRGGGLSVIVFAISVSAFIVFAFIVSTISVLHCFDYHIHCFHIVLDFAFVVFRKVKCKPLKLSVNPSS